MGSYPKNPETRSHMVRRSWVLGTVTPRVSDNFPTVKFFIAENNNLSNNCPKVDEFLNFD